MGLFDAQGLYETFTPPAYTAERNALTPLILQQLNQQLAGMPTTADFRAQRGGLQSVQQQFLDASNQIGLNFGARGLGDSGFQARAQGGLLGQRAQAEADIRNQFFQNIFARQKEAAAQSSQFLVGQRAGSGTITQRG